MFLTEEDNFNNAGIVFPIHLRILFETLHSFFLKTMFFIDALLNKYCWEVYFDLEFFSPNTVAA